MAKILKASAAEEFFKNETSISDGHEPTKSQVDIPSIMPTISEKQKTEATTKNSFSVELDVRKKKDMRVSVAVNKEDYNNFSAACAIRNIKKNDAINQLIKQFVKATL